MAWAGHAAAEAPLGQLAIIGDAFHVLAAGAWLGALFPLALLLHAASDASGADARPYAVLGIRRFSALALALMLTLAATGLGNAVVEVAGFPALVGTRYGWLLMLKVLILAPIAALALTNRRRLLPALSADGPTVGRPAMVRLSRFMRWELTLALAIVAVTTALSLTPPARHESPWWPFSFRLSYGAVAGRPGIGVRLFIGSQLAFIGLLVVIIGGLIHRAFLVGAGALAFVAALWIALPPLAVDAYPTTYQRSPVPYQAASIARGLDFYAARCAECHGRHGRGDGAGGAGLPRLPADLTAAHTAQHTAGDLFWWISHGIPQSGMPPFGTTLSTEERWDLVNVLRALAAGTQAAALTPVVGSDAPRLVAPDFAYEIGPTPTRALRDFRERRTVLLVFFSLPNSRERLGRLAEHYASFQIRGGEILAVPFSAGRDVIRRLGDHPPILFPVATDGDGDVARTYRLFASATDPASTPHVEFLVDRQGYLRARWRAGEPGPGWSDLRLLVGQLEALNAEVPAELPPDDHVH
jgi:putative copper resistance protein D